MTKMNFSNSVLWAVKRNSIRIIDTVLSTCGMEVFSQFKFSIKLPKSLKKLLPTEELTVMHLAAYFDALEIFIFLVQKGFDPWISMKEAIYPLHYGVSANSQEIVSYLINSCNKGGNDIQELNFCGFSHSHPLILASIANSSALTMMLCSWFSDKVDSATWIAALGYSITVKSRNTLQCLLRSQYGRRYSSEVSPLTLAVVADMPDALFLLLDQGFNERYANDELFTPLYTACILAKMDCVKILLSKELELGLETQGEGKAPSLVVAAISSGSIEILRLLFDRFSELLNDVTIVSLFDFLIMFSSQ